MKTLIVKNIKNEENLISYIKKSFPSIVTSMIYQKRISSDIMVKNGDEISLYISDNFLYNLPQKINTIYEDENVLIVFKPQGLLTNDPTKSEPGLESILENNTLTLCHRLDRNTAGLVIFAKNKNSSQCMLDGFKSGYINKEYLAYVGNCNFKKEHEILEQYLLHDSISEFSKIVSKEIKGSVKIITEYKVLNQYKDLDYAILNVKIHTGKTHQIRCVMSHISHPIIGDSKYGKNDLNKKFKTNKQLLFAYKYSFNFPENSFLYYLNKIKVVLDKKYINECIVSDIIKK